MTCKCFEPAAYWRVTVATVYNIRHWQSSTMPQHNQSFGYFYLVIWCCGGKNICYSSKAGLLFHLRWVILPLLFLTRLITVCCWTVSLSPPCCQYYNTMHSSGRWHDRNKKLKVELSSTLHYFWLYFIKTLSIGWVFNRHICVQTTTWTDWFTLQWLSLQVATLIR